MFKKLIATAALAACCVGAQAQTTQTVFDLDGQSFIALLDTLTITSLSNVTGTLSFATGTLDLGLMSLSLVNPNSDVSVSLGAAGVFTAQPSGYSFAFSNVAAGDYLLSVKGFNAIGSTAVSATYSVTAVPEPETYAMMLLGLGAVGFLSRRRQAAKA